MNGYCRLGSGECKCYSDGPCDFWISYENHNDTDKELLERINKFLIGFISHESGWNKPSQEDFQEFYDICCDIRDAKWGRDEDNDPTIEIELTDRSVGRRPYIPTIPYIDYYMPLSDEHWKTAAYLTDIISSLSREISLILDHHRNEGEKCSNTK